MHVVGIIALTLGAALLALLATMLARAAACPCARITSYNVCYTKLLRFRRRAWIPPDSDGTNSVHRYGGER